ncbi:PucR family transcriptional regulator [Nocardia jejuensis]|uniref:PucR family transcriptional regulator n=1 Tax=Nocardia jejuensis TaxID=328049 RepID=UPI00083388BE|nr:helix-turn-helix domain-containing protein [Nocardia jejuensis]
MTFDNGERPGLSVSGKPMSAALEDILALSQHMVGHFVEHVAPCGTLPSDAIHGDVTAITRICLELAIGMLDGEDLPAETERLRDAAAQWAREGVPIDTIHHAVHEGFRIGVDVVVTNAASRQLRTDATGPVLTAGDYENLLYGLRLVVRMLDRMTTEISLAYVRELRSVVSEHHTAVHTLTSALLGGHSTSTMARECGIEIAPSYHVLAVSIPPHPQEFDIRVDGKVVARRKLRRVQAELATRCGASALSLLSVDGGTILIPSGASSPADLDELIAGLSEAAEVSVMATVVTAVPREVPGAVEQARELLDMVQRLQCERGLYGFDELALEFQLTRPGPGREYLGSLLDPLDAYPELVDTLRRHISNNLNRRRTARLLHVHTNTIDYRLKRIGHLTGFDPTQLTGLWYLRSALVARSYRT